VPLALLPPPSLISFPRSRTEGKIKRGEERSSLPDSMEGHSPALKDVGPVLRSEGPNSRAPAEGKRRCSGGSRVTGGEQQGVARWGGAPTVVKRRGGGQVRARLTRDLDGGRRQQPAAQPDLATPICSGGAWEETTGKGRRGNRRDRITTTGRSICSA